MSTSAEQVGRLLALIPFLQSHRGASVADAARTFGVSEQQIIADLGITWMCGLPGGLPDDLIEIDMDAAREGGRIDLTNADYLSRPTRFTPDEAMSLMVALRVVAELVPAELAPAVASALAKLESLTGDRTGERVVIEVSAGVDQVREALTRAIENRARVRLHYDSATRSSQPLVDPVRIDLRDGVAYLQAWSLDRAAWRTFRIERISACESTGAQAEDHGPAPDPEPGWFNHLRGDNEITLALAPGVAWAGEYYPTTLTPPRLLDAAGPDEVVCTFPVADPEWSVGLQLRLGSRARVVDPPHAGDEAAQRALDALALIESTHRPA